MMTGRNVIILGCGRSGTSCLTGCIASTEYSIGGKGHPGNQGNPKGYFETKEVNNINDMMLFSDPRSVLTKGSQHGWLARFPVDMFPKELPNTEARIKSIVSRQPFCLKDPRFSYTLPVWSQYLPDVACICVIRHPGAVVNSMMKNCETAPYLSRIKIDRSICYDIWVSMYDHLLCLAKSDWLFLHYDQILDQSGLDDVEELIETKIDRSFPTTSLCRSEQAEDVPVLVVKIYEALCDKARYERSQ